MAFKFYNYYYGISLTFFTFLCIFCNGSASAIIDSVTVINETYITDKNVSSVKLLLLLNGSQLDLNLKIRPSLHISENGSECINDEFSEKEFWIEWSNSTFLIISIVFDEPFIFADYTLTLCMLEVSVNDKNNNPPKWLNQGSDAKFRTKRFSDSEYNFISAPRQSKWNRFRRQNAVPDSNQLNQFIHKSQLILYGTRLEFSDPPAGYDDDGSANPTLLVGSIATYRLFGTGWNKNIKFVWTETLAAAGSQCERPTGEETKIDWNVDENDTFVKLTMKIPQPQNGAKIATLYLCYLEDRNLTIGDVKVFRHLGDFPVMVRERIIALWVQIVIILVCLSFSSLFSGLNLGLLSLNKTDLKIISKTGTEKERHYAQAIYPVRIHGNYLLCSILLGNVLVNSIFTILLDDLSSGIVAVVVSTLCIVVVGEICPQAVCSRHGLAIGAKTIYVTKTVMGLTAPLSYPLSRLLDWILGEEIATTYTRERLKELVKVTTEFNDLEKDEVNIISGALELRKKTVGEVMTKIEDVYMLSYDTILDFETVSEIMKSGFSRIPVYEGTRRNIVSLLYIKDLALIDPDDNTPLKTLSQFYQNSCYYVFDDTTLDVVFKQFKDGCKGHMAFVHRVNNEGEGDPFYETVGIVTLEDVIEELIQAEIMDETDVYTDNRSKQRRSGRMLRNKDFSLFAERNENQRVHISPQLNLAAFQFLQSSVEALKPDNISEMVLLRLLKQDVIFHIKMKDKEKMKDDLACYLYQQGKAADYFILILEGRVEVTVGRENLIFESGPFTYFGSQALLPNIGVAESPTNNVAQPMGSLQSVNLESMIRYTFIPDYTVRAITEVYYVRISRSIYLAAKKATLMERSKKVSNAGEQFDDEVEKLLHNYNKTGGGDNEREDSFSNPQNIQFIEDSARSSPIQTDSLNNGFISGTVSPSRTPHTREQTEEKTTLLGNTSGGNHDDRLVNS